MTVFCKNSIGNASVPELAIKGPREQGGHICPGHGISTMMRKAGKRCDGRHKGCNKGTNGGMEKTESRKA